MVCLIRPPVAETFRFSTLSATPPLGLAYVAGALEAANRPVHVVDAVAEGPRERTRYIKGYLIGLSLEDIVARVPAEDTVVGISVVFTHEWPAVVRLVELLKAARPDAFVVLGGEHVTSMPEFCLRTSRADALVLGEGEETVVELVDALESGAPLAGIAGLAWRDGERVVRNPRRARRAEVDDIAWPAWHLFDLQTYYEHRFVGGIFTDDLTVPILATRGCPYQCTFCSAPNMWLPRWIPRDPVNVVDEIEHYVRTYGARNFPFQDLTAIVRKDWIQAFCQEIIDRGLEISWQMPSGTRSEAVDPEVADLLRRSGMISMAYAPESGSETTRRYIKKRMQTDRLFESIRSAVAADLNVAVFVIVGFPHDDAELVRENLPFVRRAAREGVTDLSVGFYMALPGTELFQSLYDSGRIRIDRRYFRHILHSLTLWPSQSFCDHLGVARMAWLKLRLLLAFYAAGRSAQAEQRRGGLPLLAAIVRAIRGVRLGKHASKLETVFRNAVTSLWDTVRVQLRPGWMSRSQERALFRDWDGIYREIRDVKRAAGELPASPLDMRQLHRGNVVHALRREHERAGDFGARTATSAPVAMETAAAASGGAPGA